MNTIIYNEITVTRPFNILLHTNQGIHCPGTTPEPHTGLCPGPSCRWKWGRRTHPPPGGLSGCYPTEDPDPAPHTLTNTLSQTQMPLEIVDSEKGISAKIIFAWHLKQVYQPSVVSCVIPVVCSQVCIRVKSKETEVAVVGTHTVCKY